MRIRRLALAALAALTVTAAAVPAFAHDDRGAGHGWRERAWREHEQREHARREWQREEWREHHSRPYAVIPGYVAPPTPYHDAPRYYR